MSHSFIIEKSASLFLSHHFSQAVHSRSTLAHTRANTVLNLTTACTGGGVCFCSGGDRVEGRIEGIARSRLICIFMSSEHQSTARSPRPDSNCNQTVRDEDFVMQMKSRSSIPRGRTAHARVASVETQLHFGRHPLSLPWHESTRARLLLPQASKQKWLKLKGGELKRER